MSLGQAIVAAVAWAVTRHPRLRQPALSPHTFLRVVLPIGVCTALDIGFSNWSLVFISVAFHTILKGSIPLFVLLCGWVLGLEPCRLLTFTSILLVCAGIGLACSAEVTFSVAGFALGVGSCLMAGMRWALTQLLIKGKGGGQGGAATRARPAPAPAPAPATTEGAPSDAPPLPWPNPNPHPHPHPHPHTNPTLDTAL